MRILEIKYCDYCGNQISKENPPANINCLDILDKNNKELFRKQLEESMSFDDHPVLKNCVEMTSYLCCNCFQEIIKENTEFYDQRYRRLLFNFSKNKKRKEIFLVALEAQYEALLKSEEENNAN